VLFGGERDVLALDAEVVRHAALGEEGTQPIVATLLRMCLCVRVRARM
jgi:hypothetical protein